MWKNGEGIQVETALSDMLIPDLKVMAHELGVTFRSKPSRKDLFTGIKGRINESVMLSRNINTTQPRHIQQKEEGSLD